MIPGSLLLVSLLSALAALAMIRFRVAWTVAMLVSLGGMFAGAIGALVKDGEWLWTSVFRVGGEEVVLRLDALSGLFLALMSVVGAAGAVYAGEYWSDGAHRRSAPRGRFWWTLLLVSLSFVLLSSNGLHFLIAWELFTLSSYFLITLERQKSEVRSAGWLYLAASHVGTICLFAYFGTVAARTGTWELGPMREQVALAPLFWIALVGFGIKCGTFPLHVWLPSAHANAPSHVSAMLSGATIKMGIYGLLRVSSWLPVPSSAGWVVVVLGVVSAVLGVAFALGQHDLKRLLAYHSVENIGIILIGLGFALVAVQRGGASWGQLALAGCLLHVWNHGLFKALLFLGAGSVLHATGTREMSRLGGLWKTMPWTAGLFGLGAAAIAGLPPLNGFVSEWLVFLGLFDAAIAHGPTAWAALPAAVLLGVTGALALACFVKVCGIVFLGAPRSEEAKHSHECGPAMRGPMIVLATACVAIGLAPLFFLPAIRRAIAVWSPAWDSTEIAAPVGSLGIAHGALAVFAIVAGGWLLRSKRSTVARVLTWDCGYAFPTARMQYTAGSFAATITEWFAWILCPARHEQPVEGFFPCAARVEEHTPETVLEHVIEPTGGLVLQISATVRKLQHGRLQSYLLYLVIGLTGLAVIVVGGGQ